MRGVQLNAFSYVVCECVDVTNFPSQKVRFFFVGPGPNHQYRPTIFKIENQQWPVTISHFVPIGANTIVILSIQRDDGSERSPLIAHVRIALTSKVWPVFNHTLWFIAEECRQLGYRELRAFPMKNRDNQGHTYTQNYQ